MTVGVGEGREKNLFKVPLTPPLPLGPGTYSDIKQSKPSPSVPN